MSDNPRVLGNRYEIGDLLGRGGMAEVHLGRDTRLGRVVAIKLLRTDLARDPIFQARFRREAQSAAALNHPAIVAVYDTGEEQIVDSGGGVVALPYIVMEYVEGRTLRELLMQGQPLDPAQAVDVTIGVLSALEYSHRAGIVHRDIKPANVMLTPNGDIKVMDFGIARALADVSATMTQTQAVIGTAQYLSPEQARGETVDARSDLYSAGCLLFELVTGRPPFVADSPVAVAYQHVREAPPTPSSLNPAISDELDRVILHSLAKDREARYQSAGEFRADLDRLRSGQPVLAPPIGMAAADGASTEYLPQNAATEQMTGQARPNFGALAVPVSGDTYAQGYPAQPGYPTAQGYPTGQTAQYGEYGYQDGQRPRDRQGSGRNAGFVMLGVLSVALIAAIVYLFVSNNRAAETVAVPLVTGFSQAEAQSKLSQVGLQADVTEADNEGVPAGTVAEQNPAEGQQVEAGSTVALVVSAGSASVSVPDVTGMTQDQARAALESAELTVGNISTVDSATVAKDRVVETQPAKTTSVAKGDEVKLVLSTGQVKVPEVVGASVDEATKTLRDLGIDVNREDEQSDQAEGTVLAQSLEPGSTVDNRGTSITLKVAIPLEAVEPPAESPVEPEPGDNGEAPSPDPNASPGG